MQNASQRRAPRCKFSNEDGKYYGSSVTRIREAVCNQPQYMAYSGK